MSCCSAARAAPAASVLEEGQACGARHGETRRATPCLPLIYFDVVAHDASPTANSGCRSVCFA